MGDVTTTNFVLQFTNVSPIIIILISLIFVQHEKEVLDELQIGHLQKKQLLNKATELVACLDKGMEYNWTPDQVGL